MKPDEARIFLSYTHKDEAEVMKLYRRLKEAGYNPWIDSEDILGGEDWEKATEKAIEEAALFLPCITHNSITHRGMVQKEITFALEVWKNKLESDIYLIPIRLEDCSIPGSLARFHCISLFKENGFQRLIYSIDAAFERLEVIQPIRLRSEPIEKLSEDEVKEMLRANDFYDVNWYWMGIGIQHDYKAQTIDGDKVIIDHTTGLMWQQGGSEYRMFMIHPSAVRLSDEVTKKEAPKKYINYLNHCKFASYNDWRLPTLEEVMSLMEPKKSDNGRYINPLFDATQRLIWTADHHSASIAWLVNFLYGYCYDGHVARSHYVRAVRSR